LRLKKTANAIALHSMSRLALAVLSFTILLDFAVAEDLPLYRPALIGTSPDAIINRIDTKLLLKAGQKDAAVMFSAVVDSHGDVKLSATFRGTPDSKLLEQEVLRVLRDAKMIPAVRNHQPIAVFYYGTVIFRRINDKPRLRIFANQELKELSAENDFIGPQLCFGGDSGFAGVHYPEDQVAVPVTGEVDLSLKIDANGNLQGEKVAAEHPPFLGFGEAAQADIANAKFIPAFRNGQPVACEVTLPLFYSPKS
jgi:TonB family protein